MAAGSTTDDKTLSNKGIKIMKKWQPAKKIGYRLYEYNGYTIEYNEDSGEWAIFTMGDDRQWIDTWDTMTACKCAIKKIEGKEF